MPDNDGAHLLTAAQETRDASIALLRSARLPESACMFAGFVAGGARFLNETAAFKAGLVSASADEVLILHLDMARAMITAMRESLRSELGVRERLTETEMAANAEATRVPGKRLRRVMLEAFGPVLGDMATSRIVRSMASHIAAVASIASEKVAEGEFTPTAAAARMEVILDEFERALGLLAPANESEA